MWHDLVSSLESTMQLMMFGLVLMGSQHPLATAGIVLLFALLAAMLLAEHFEERKAGLQSGEAVRIRIKR